MAPVFLSRFGTGGSRSGVGCLGGVGCLLGLRGVVGAGILEVLWFLLVPTALEVTVRRVRVRSRVGVEGVVVLLFLEVKSRRLITDRLFCLSKLVKWTPLGQCLVSRVKFVPVNLNVFLIYGPRGVVVAMVRCGLLGLLYMLSSAFLLFVSRV